MLWNKISKFNLGLRKGQIELVDHDPNWNHAFSVLSNELRLMIPAEVCLFFHIGSTSIPGICAKPVLDVLGTTPSLALFDSNKEVFEKIGFTWKGEFGISGRRYMPLYDDTGLTAFVHLHVFQSDATEVKANIGFRDQLRSQLELALEYNSLKLKLASEFAGQREKYSRAKSDFIQKISEHANR